MTIRDIRDLLGATVLAGDEWLGKEVQAAFSSDLMSDVLAYVRDESVLITGLVNPQSVRTAEMMDMDCIIFVRGKIPTDEMINMARSKGITVITSNMNMFTTCGILYSSGLAGGKCRV